MFGKPVGDGFARSNDAQNRQSRTLHRDGTWKNRTLRAVGGLSLSVALVASMSFSGVVPSFAAGADHAEETGSVTNSESTVDVQASESASATSNESTKASEDSSAPSEKTEKISDSAVESTASKPTAEAEETTSPTDESAKQSSKRVADDSGIGLRSVGPDGTAAPYVYWNVADPDGNPIEGATFTLDQRSGNRWTGTRNVSDCSSGTCTGVDRDADAGEFLAKWIGNDRPGANPTDSTQVTSNGRYRLTRGEAPTGYVWVSSPTEIDLSNKTWSNETLNFGTFTVKKVNYQPICLPSYVYGITAQGQIRQVAADGSVSNLGNAVPANNVDMNGLGIGAGGTAAYAYSRSNNVQTASIYKYNVSTGQWSPTNASVNSTDPDLRVQFVAGAVDLDSGRYFFGGYASTGDNRPFNVWEYNPATNAITYKGGIATDTPFGVATNGDMAFDAKGNLFVVRGTDNTTTVYSVTAENLKNATGSTIPSSKTPGFTTMGNVNGLAFDADGRAYLGSGDALRSYAMPGWNDRKDVTAALGGSTDLASCGSPPTITIEKYIEGDRVASSDQFTLTLRQGGTNGTLIGTATTTGNAKGLQGERVGPLPTVRNVDLNFSESAAGTTTLGNYASSYRCLVDGVQTTQGNGTAGTIKIPANGQSVECRFYNSPLVAQVNVNKQITDSQGKNAKPGSDWTVGASAQATSATVTSEPAKNTQQTNSQGDASWKFRFSNSSGKANLNVSELMRNGYKFANGTCEVTKLDGTKTSTQLSGAEANPAVNIVPGDVVDCKIVNSLKPASVSVGKQMLDSNGENPQPVAGWTVGASLATSSDSGVSITDPATAKTVANGQVETPWVVHFPTDPKATGNVTVKEVMQDGYKFKSAVCGITSDDGTRVNQTITATSGTLGGLKPGDAVECIFANQQQTGVATWTKVDGGGVTLSGSEWELSGPGVNGPTIEINDCIEETAAECTGADKDPAAGAFKLSGLTWGEYTLTETKAPAGYVLDDNEHRFTIGTSGDAKLIWDLGNMENEQRPALALPLTGGMGTQSFIITGSIALMAALGVVAWRRRKAVARG